MDISIPRIIMQMYDDHNVPFRWITSPASVRQYIPQWKYVFLTREIYRDFVIKYFPDYLFHYDSLPHDIQRAHAICYMWMYKVGGVYMSLNFELAKNLDSLFYYDHGDAYFVPSSNDSKWYANSFMAAKPGCPIFLECLAAMKNLSPWWCLDRQSKILYTTGPGMLSRVLKKTKIPFNIINSHDIPSCSVCGTQRNIPGSYVNRLADESWDEWDTYFYNVMYCNWKWILMLATIIVVATWIYIKMQKTPKKKIYIKKGNKSGSPKSPRKENHNGMGDWNIKTEFL